MPTIPAWAKRRAETRALNAPADSLPDATRKSARHAGHALLTGVLRRRSTLFWLLQTVGWIAFGVVMYIWGLAYWSAFDAFVNKALLVVLGVALTLVLRRIYRRAAARRPSAAATGALLVACSFAAAAAWVTVQSLLFQAFSSYLHQGRIAVEPYAPAIGTLLFHGFVLLCWSLLYHGLHAWDDAERERERAEHAEARAQAARLRALQAQLNPHFVFNALNVVSTLVDEGENAAAKKMIARLGEFLRLALDTLDTPEISVAEELEFVRSYLDIEQVRFGERLQATIEVAPAALTALIPTLILQPIVENSVRHGILSRERGGRIRIDIAADGARLKIRVADDGSGAAAGGVPRQGVGLANTAGRLAELYGDRATLDFVRTAGGAVTTLDIPLRPRTTPAPARREEAA
jgi:two-component sensor histidine kinase